MTQTEQSAEDAEVLADSSGIPHLGFSDHAALTKWTEDELLPRMIDWPTEQLGGENLEMAASAAEVIVEEKQSPMFMSQSATLLDSLCLP